MLPLLCCIIVQLLSEPLVESSESNMPLYAFFFFFNWAVLFLLVGYCSSDYPSRIMMLATEVTMVASSSGWTWSFWYDSDLFSTDSSEVGWHPSSSLIFIFYHFRLGHGGACLAQILWRWVGISSSVFSFHYSCLYITSLLFSMTCLLPQVVWYCIVIFHFLLPHLCPFSSGYTSHGCDINLL